MIIKNTYLSIGLYNDKHTQIVGKALVDWKKNISSSEALKFMGALFQSVWRNLVLMSQKKVRLKQKCHYKTYWLLKYILVIWFQGVFIGSGRDFKLGKSVHPFQNVELFNLMTGMCPSLLLTSIYPQNPFRSIYACKRMPSAYRDDRYNQNVALSKW